MYKSLSSALQSRIAKRAAFITQGEAVKQLHRGARQMQDYDNIKTVLAREVYDQILDKMILNLIRKVEDKFFSQSLEQHDNG